MKNDFTTPTNDEATSDDDVETRDIETFDDEKRDDIDETRNEVDETDDEATSDDETGDEASNNDATFGDGTTESSLDDTTAKTLIIADPESLLKAAGGSFKKRPPCGAAFSLTRYYVVMIFDRSYVLPTI